METNNIQPSVGEIILYETEDGRTRVECRFFDETLWLSQAQIADLFGITTPTVNEHLKALYDSEELVPEATIRKFRIVRLEGKRQVARAIDHYNLEAILAVGYRVRSARGSQFRRWASERLQEYLVKGFTMDDERLKNPPSPEQGIPDYFDELLERIRDIRASEARLYLRVREIFALASDYQSAASETRAFFQTVQNKLHYAATGMTAAELLRDRADHLPPHMGLTSFTGKQVAKREVSTARNYLSEEEISELNRIVTMWLDFAEDQAKRRQQIYKKDWQQKLDSFLAFNDRILLDGAGRISHKNAVTYAENEYEAFAARRRALLEAEGERTSIEALEQAAKSIKEPGK